MMMRMEGEAWVIGKYKTWSLPSRYGSEENGGSENIVGRQLGSKLMGSTKKVASVFHRNVHIVQRSRVCTRPSRAMPAPHIWVIVTGNTKTRSYCLYWRYCQLRDYAQTGPLYTDMTYQQKMSTLKTQSYAISSQRCRTEALIIHWKCRHGMDCQTRLFSQTVMSSLFVCPCFPKWPGYRQSICVYKNNPLLCSSPEMGRY